MSRHQPVTAQEFFDLTVIGIRQQGLPAFVKSGDKGYCMYRTPNGTKCAIGLHITDDEYRPEMEKRQIKELVLEGFLPPNHVLAEHLKLASELQESHDWAAKGLSQARDIPGHPVHQQGDSFTFISLFNSNVRDRATRHNLIYTENYE